MKAKGPITQLGGLKGGEVQKNTAAPSGGAGGGRGSSFHSGSKIKHHVPLHTDHKRSTKSGNC